MRKTLFRRKRHMKLIDAINNVDRSISNSFDASYEEFCQELNIHDFGWNDEFGKRVIGYYLIKWICTDTWVGSCVYYFDGKPVAVSSQSARKSSTNYLFVSEEAANRVRDFILSLQRQDALDVSLIDPNEEIEDTYDVHFSGQLLTKDGFVNGEPCKVINTFRENYTSQKVEVQFRDGRKLVTPVRNFKIPLSVKIPKKRKLKKRKPLDLKGLNIEVLMLPFKKDDIFNVKRVFRKETLYISR